MEWTNGKGRQTAGQGGPLQEQLRAWRQVATEREQACEELERINHWLEQENQRLETALEQLRREKMAVEATAVTAARDATAAQVALAEQIARAAQLVLPPPPPPPPTPTLKRCLAHYLRLVLPYETLRGRAVRKGYRVAKRLLRRSA
jgi:hypothetical protein